MPLAATELVRRWRLRQYEILKALPPDLFAEYHQLEALARVVEAKETGTTIKIVNDLLAAFADAPLGSQQPQQQIPLGGPPQQNITLGTLPQQNIPLGAPPRIPMSVHKERLIDFLCIEGPATRGKIFQRTRIPLGSLSELLKGREFRQADRGSWDVTEAARKKRVEEAQEKASSFLEKDKD